MNSVTVEATRQNYWKNWLAAHLPAELCAQLSGCTERDGVLVVFAASGAWGARLRFALLELEAELRAAQPEISAVKVRVMPRR